jgi:hypothetical protein
MKRGLHHPGQADHGPDRARSDRRTSRPRQDTAFKLETELSAERPITRSEVDAIARLLGENLKKLLDSDTQQ